MSGIVIRELDLAAATDAALGEIYQLSAVLHAEALPDEPFRPLDLSLLEYRTALPEEVRRWWVAHRDGMLVGHGIATWDDLPDQREHAFLNASVHPLARRSGLGSELIRLGLDAADEWGVKTIDLWARVSGPSDAFLRFLGAELRSVTRRSVVRTADLDVKMLKGWIGRAGERASGYRLVGWDGPCPEEHLEAFVALNGVLDTAPRDEGDDGDFVLTPERLREHEAMWAEQGFERWTLCALHEDSGDLAGFTEMTFHVLRPDLANQEDTGVWPKHRERGLGRWLKATMALRLLEERPEVIRIDTTNAEGNQSMRDINEAMGFRPVENWGAWQAPLVRARRAVATRRRPFNGG